MATQIQTQTTPKEVIGKLPDGTDAFVGNTNQQNNFTVPVTDIKPATSLKLPQPEIPVDHASSIVAGAKEGQKAIQGYIDEITPAETPLDQERTGFISRLKTLIPGLTGRGEAQQQAEEDQGVPLMRKKLADLNGEIGIRSAQYDKLFSDMEVNGRGVPFSVVQGQQGAIRRSQAADIGLLHARALGLQGSLEAAQSLADRSVDLKYQDREAEIDATMKQLDAIAPLLTKEEKIQAEARTQYLSDKKQEIQDLKDREKNNIKYAIENNAQDQFYRRGGTVIRTSDGYEFHDMAEALKAGVKADLSNAPVLEPLDVIKARTEAIAKGTTPESQGFSTPPANGFRTDRNNNPTAMTTDVARSLGLIEGQDYIVGDKFPGNSSLYTAKLIGDPIETTIRGLDNAAQSGLGAFRTRGGKPRWSYIDMTDAQWNAMSADQKKATVISMYKREGGSGQMAGQTPTDDKTAVTTYETDDSGTTWKVVTKNGKVTSRTEQKTSDKVSQDIIDTVGSNLQSAAGGDGYISPEDYNDGLQQWVGQGYSAKTYYDNYKKFVNPADPQDYHYYPNQ